jgi:hypothetical protein
MSALICTGFYSNSADFLTKLDFYEHVWLPNTGLRSIVVVNNSEFKLPDKPKVRVIDVEGNLGHVGSIMGQFRPHVAGFTMSWMIPALIAYSDGRDFIYKEQDCLAFGDWETSIVEEAASRKLLAAFGSCDPAVAACEQSLFWIQRDFITEFVWSYLSFPDGDGKILPETKFSNMAGRDFRIGRFSMGVGRSRPIPAEQIPWYAQKFTADELARLKESKLI